MFILRSLVNAQINATADEGCMGRPHTTSIGDAHT